MCVCLTNCFNFGAGVNRDTLVENGANFVDPENPIRHYCIPGFGVSASPVSACSSTPSKLPGKGLRDVPVLFSLVLV